MRLIVSGNVYNTRFRHRGKDWELSTGVRIDEPDAKRRAQEAAALRKAEVITREGVGGKGFAAKVSLAACEELDLQRAERENCTKAHIKVLRAMWRKLFNYLGGENRFVETLTIADVNGYEYTRRSVEKGKGQTIVRERRALIRGLKLAAQDGLLERMPFDPTLLDNVRRNPKDVARKGILHSDDHIALVLAHMSDKAVKRGHVDMVRLLMMTGLRISELQRLLTFRRTGTSFGAIIHVRSSKETTEQTEERDIPIYHAGVDIIREFGANFAKADLDDSLSLASEKAGLERGVIPRDCRVWYISNAVAIDPAAAQKLAGHANFATTAMYVQTEGDRAKLTGLAVTGSHLGRGLTRGQGGGRQAVTPKNLNDYCAVQGSNLCPIAPEATEHQQNQALSEKNRAE